MMTNLGCIIKEYRFQTQGVSKAMLLSGTTPSLVVDEKNLSRWTILKMHSNRNGAPCKDICSGGCWHCKKRQGTRSCRSRVRGFSGDRRQTGLARHQAGVLRSTATGFQGTWWLLKCSNFTAVFIRDCFEDELVPVFASVGKIYELRLMIEFSGTNRTYCYVRYKFARHYYIPG